MPQSDPLTEARVDIARLEMAVELMGKQVTELQAANTALGAKLDTVLETLSEARGGWKAMMWLGGAGATICGGLAWLLQHLGGKAA
jgi:hypothetical protein